VASPENPSKRERQKQRREAKLAQQRVVAAKERRNRLIVFALLGVIFAGLVGAAIARNRADVARKNEEVAAAEANREELGCTPVEEPDDLGQGHLDASSLSEEPPDALYPDRPATSGRHFGSWLKTGVYDVDVDERALVHNLEHGYVLAYYNPDAPEEQVTALKEQAQEQIDGDFAKLIVAPWEGQLPGEKNFAYTAWNARQSCTEYDEQTFQVFLEAKHSARGVAPEKGLPPHLEEGGGTIDPKGEPFLLPPLGTTAAPSEGTDDGASDPPSEPAADEES
jgi:hypothetical protein